nr:transcriptional repressor [Allomuricauda sp.]
MLLPFGTGGGNSAIKMLEKITVDIFNDSSQNLLEKKGLKKTKLRLELIQHFKEAKHAQAYSDLKQALVSDVDKSTLYRNLSIFEEVGLIHGINDHTGVTKYALGSEPSSGHGHAHFVCECCETVYCMNGTTELQFEMPHGFKPKNVQTIIKGICANC